MTDLELVKRIRHGDKEAFNLLCRDNYAAFVAYARIFLSADGAEDVVQDVLLNVWRGRARLQEDQPLQGYILRSIHNRALNQISKDRSSADYKQWYKSLIMSLTIFYCDPENNDTIQKLYQSDLQKTLNDAIAALPPRCREVFRLGYIEQKSSKEIAEELGISVSTVSNHLHNALVSLRQALAGTALAAIFALFQ